MKARYSFPWFEWLAFLLFIFVVAKFTFTGIDLMVTHDVDPKEFEKKVSRLLGVQEDVAYSLDGDTLALAKENNLDEESLAAAIAASQWVKENHGFNVSVGILYTIDMAEWRGGGNPGDCDSVTAAHGNDNLNGAQEEAAAKKLLAHWKLHNVRANGDLQFEQIYPDYSGMLGHCSSGENGPGFINTTGWRVCEIGLMPFKDTEDCDYRKHDTGVKAIAYEVGRMCKEGINNKCLLGWNRSQEYINRLVATAAKLDGRLGTNLTASIDTGINFGNGSALRRQLVLLYLKLWDLEEPQRVRTTFMGAHTIYFLVGHMSQVNVTVDQPVDQGDILGLCGDTGVSTGSHTHIEMADVNPTSLPYRQKKEGSSPGKFDPLTLMGSEGWLKWPFPEENKVITAEYPEGISQYFMKACTGAGCDSAGQHPATDFPCVTGVPLLALAGGTVVEIDTDESNSWGYGKYVVVAVPVSAASVGETIIGINGLADPLPGGHVSGYTFAKFLGKRANGTDKIHWGVDMSYDDYQDKWIYAMHDGTVEYASFLETATSQAGEWWVSGETIAIRGTTADGHEIWTCYGHGESGTLQVKVGDPVKAGQPLMQMGNTGLTGGNYHLHLCMKIDGKWVDPMTYVNEIREHPVAESTTSPGEDYEVNTNPSSDEEFNPEFQVPTPIP